ncbi:quinone oxidoreductase family protein [Maribacter sp. 2-571]|uniref:quinone oxidoreductase family protein n=1 Tax=Maribacter sp. 2-571 TaxID=3417569 RepID=UPI003D33210B
MISLGIFPEELNSDDSIKSYGSFSLENEQINVGLIEEEDLELSNSSDPDNRVLVKKKAISCNYRDKSLTFKYNKQVSDKMEMGVPSFSYIGSEFVGEVVDVGKNVSGFKIGDRVISNIAYPSYDPTYAGGLATNHGSRRIDDFYPNKLIKISNKIPDEVAACLSIAGFTAHSMVRKVVRPNIKVLVTAGRSSTSLAAISALKNHPVEVYVMSSTDQNNNELKELGATDVIMVNHDTDSYLPDIQKVIKDFTGFDAVIDPLFDIHLPKITELMTYDSKYVTCGFYNQFPLFSKTSFEPRGKSFSEIITEVMTKNISLIGNCIGSYEDGIKAIKDCESGKFQVVVDKVFSKGEESEFFDATYNFKEKFGKVVYRYD